MDKKWIIGIASLLVVAVVVVGLVVLLPEEQQVVPPQDVVAPPERVPPEVRVVDPDVAEFEVSNLTVTPSEVKPGEPVTITAKVTNVGAHPGTYTVELVIDGEVEASQSVTLAGGEEKTVSFTVTRREPRTFTVRIVRLSATFLVEAPPELIRPPHELARIGDFSIALAHVEREEEITTLHFGITKVAHTHAGPQTLAVTLIDPHGHEYRGTLNIDLEGAADFVLNALPIGFTYLDIVEIRMPRIAPIDRIRLGEEEIAFADVRFGRPEFLKDFGALAVAKGESVQVGEFLHPSVERITWVLDRYNTDLTIENTTFIPSWAHIRTGIQKEDGTILWGDSRSIEVPALGDAKTFTSVVAREEIAQARILLLAFTDKEAGENTFRILPIVPDELARVELKWYFQTGGAVSSSPAIAADGTIIVGSDDNKVYALNPDGSLKWYFETGGPVHTSPAIAADGTIIVGARRNIYALNPDGSLRWSFETGGHVSSPSIAADGTIVVGAGRNIYALNPDGSLSWSYRTWRPVASCPAIAADGTIYIGSWDGLLYALNPDGSLRWSFRTGCDVISSLAIAADGTIIVGSDRSIGWHRRGGIYALNPDGTLKWSFRTRDRISSSPAIAADGTIFVGSWDHNIYALNPDGSHKWSFRTGGAVRSSPAIGADGTIFVGSDDGNIYALNPDGTLRGSFSIGAGVRSSPAIAADGTMVVGSDDGKIYAFRTDTGGPADSPWPMFGQNARRTGRVITP